MMLAVPHPLIAIVGRPNVGKSTLFNRLLGRRKAVVHAESGTTRDCLEGSLEWRGRFLTLLDTGGWEFTRADGLSAAIQRHIQRTLDTADGFILVCDAQAGLVPADHMVMERLRKTGKPVMLAANKSDHRLMAPPEMFSLGVTEVFPVSALHGRGTSELLDDLLERFPVSSAPAASADGGRPAVAVAIVGRQNVGKSSLLNALLREERVIVSEIPGTTRDAVDTRLLVNGTPVTLIDTAGLRHRRKVRQFLDHVAMARTREAIRRCTVALVVLDATQGLTRDDQRILTEVGEAGCGCVLLVNKWDLVEKGKARTLEEAMHRAVPSTAFAPILAVSAKTGFQVAQSLSTALRVARALQRPVPDVEPQTLLQKAWAAHHPPRFRGRAISLKKARWLPGRPARLELETRPVAWLPRPYQHYLLKRLATHPTLSGVPVRLVMRGPSPSKGRA